MSLRWKEEKINVGFVKDGIEMTCDSSSPGLGDAKDCVHPLYVDGGIMSLKLT